MNKQIEKLMSELAEVNKTTNAIEAKIQAEYNKIFDADEPLQAAMKRLENFEGTDPMLSDDFVDHWLRFDLSPYKAMAEYLETYLMDGSIRADFENDALIMSGGPEVLINRDGLVYDMDSQELITKINGLDDTDGLKRIADWMDKKGYFPGVYYTDGYGYIKQISLPE